MVSCELTPAIHTGSLNFVMLRADAKINARQVQALARAQFTPDQNLTLLCISYLFDEKHIKNEKYPFQRVLKPPPAIFIKAYASFMTNVNALIVLIGSNRDAGKTLS